MENRVTLSFKNITKRFAGVVALNDVSFDIYQGEVHCIVGENGAGKSTLIKILSGAYNLEEGEIWLDGKRVLIDNPHVSTQLGIAVVYQELNVVNQLSVVDNILLGREHHSYGFANVKKNASDVVPYLKEINMDIDPNTLLAELSTAEKQMIMIAKALSLNAKVIVLDEPTAMLSDKEVETLFDIIKLLKSKSVTVIYISHRMREIFTIGDRVTVLKDGCLVDTMQIAETNMEELVVKMVGRELDKTFPPRTRIKGEKILEAVNLTNSRIKDISFELHKGEILGIAGLVGSGRTELLRAIFGADNILCGEIYLNGERVKISRPLDAVRYKIGFVPEDRRSQGIIKVLSVKDNITLIFSRLTQVLGFLRKKEDDGIVNRYIEELKIKTPGALQAVGLLSGGNQQKVVVSKWLSISPRVLLLDEPTQGIDVGAKAEIFELIDKLARQGMGVIMVSSDLMEVLNMSDTLLIMRNGQIVGKMSGEEATEEAVIKYMMGVKGYEKAV